MNIEAFGKLNIPDSPGVYFWRQGKTIIYIGKATSLHDRVHSYFAKDLISTRGPRMADMVFKADSIEWRETDSVLEALIAEANLIKEHWPYYNIKDKDDRSFNYVVITREDFPRLIVLRGRNMDLEKKKRELKVRKIFGPFPNGAALREALKIIRRVFPFLDEKSVDKDRYHFYRQIGLAPDVASALARMEYQKTIKRIILFFSGKKGALVRELEKEMSGYAKEKEFEKADEIKKSIFALTYIQDIALIKEDIENFAEMTALGSDGQEKGGFRIEAYDVAHLGGAESAGVMTVVCDGESAKSEYRKFKLSAEVGNDDMASLREIMERRLNHPEWKLPDLMVMDGGLGQLRLAERVLKDHNLVIPVVSVVKNKNHKPAGILGSAKLIKKHEKAVLLANAESHRFAIAYHRKLRRMRNPRRGKL